MAGETGPTPSQQKEPEKQMKYHISRSLRENFSEEVIEF